jgi:hypothetical protein
MNNDSGEILPRRFISIQYAYTSHILLMTPHRLNSCERHNLAIKSAECPSKGTRGSYVLESTYVENEREFGQIEAPIQFKPLDSLT